MKPGGKDQDRSKPFETTATTGSAAAAAEEAFAEPARMLFRAYQDFVADRQQACLEAQKRSNEAYFEMLAAQDRARREAWAPVEKAYEALGQAQREAGLGAEEWQRYQQALQDLWRAQQELCSNRDLQDRHAEAFRQYYRAQKEAWDQSRERWEQARQGYVSAVQRTWTQVDPERLAPEAAMAMHWSSAMALGSSWTGTSGR